jgi:hypothetical protein
VTCFKRLTSKSKQHKLNNLQFTAVIVLSKTKERYTILNAPFQVSSIETSLVEERIRFANSAVTQSHSEISRSTSVKQKRC